MFLICKSLISINIGDYNKWDTNEGIYMRSMLEGCANLNKFRTPNVIVIIKMFKG